MNASAAPSMRGGIALVALALVLGGWLGLRRDPMARDEAAASPLARTGAAPRSTSLGGIELRDTASRVSPLHPPGQPAIVMISSVTCGWCKQALRDLSQLSGGRPLSRLRMVTLEGAAGGTAMLVTAGVNGAVSLGPASQSAGTLMSLQFPGTPIFLALDSAGRVSNSIPGYPGRDELIPWLRVMLGDAETVTAAAQGTKLSPR